MTNTSSEAKRHKHGHLPGDRPKATLIAYREKNGRARRHLEELFREARIVKRLASVFRRVIKEKSATKQRQKDKKIVSAAWEETHDKR